MHTYVSEIFETLKIEHSNRGVAIGHQFMDTQGITLPSYSPIDGKLLANVRVCDEKSYQAVLAESQAAFSIWKKIPPPQRGEIVRQFGNELRKKKESLGALVSIEMGKSLQEGKGEVQEMIDICDFANGLSRQLYGLTIASERPAHRMMEQWHPLGIVGIISAFNFPVAVWAWNAALAWVCGDVTLWKPSEKTPLTALACQKIIGDVLKTNGMPPAVSCLIVGERNLGERLAKEENIPLISATGSTKMGKSVGAIVGARLGKCILELGGNNALIVSKDADLNLAIPAVVFGAIGTAGQRCTSTRRLIVQEDIYDEVIEKLKKAYLQLTIGNPLDEKNHLGPLIDSLAVQNYLDTLSKIKQEGGKTIIDGGVLSGAAFPSDFYVKPCIFEVDKNSQIAKVETFAPILYIIKFKAFEEALTIQNNVPQGLSSAVMTTNLLEAEKFLSSEGSDCGIANVNIGTSGAEIGGAFGGEKETGGGRESGSDTWKNYMRRQTNTLNYSKDLPLAQGIKFEL